MVIFLISAILALDWAVIPPSRQTVRDPPTGISVHVAVDGFRIAKTETSQQVYEQVMGQNPSLHKGPNLPVENVSWLNAISFANAVSVRNKLNPCYIVASASRKTSCNGYRLPTEAEWSAAAGTSDGNLGLASTKNASELGKLPGTRSIGSSGPNAFGVYDMSGNVWEWCEDWFNAIQSPWPVTNPRGPRRGLQRVIRGGSYVTSRTSWSRGLRSSQDPAHASGETGFRIVQSTGVLAPAIPFDQSAYRKPPQRTDFPTLAPVTKVDRAKWMQWLGAPAIAKPAPHARLVREIDDTWLRARLIDLQTEPDSWERILIVYPDEHLTTPRPVLIVPYYDVDTPAGLNLGGRNFQPLGVRSFAWLAAQQGYIAVAIRWFGESYGQRYDEAVANLARRHPGTTGLGKWVWDASRLLDYLETLPDVDRTRIAMMGHSLGGKMTMYAAAMDQRVRAAVASEPGVSFAFTNYEDYWYFGERLPKGVDQNELLALLAPRPFLLIAGEDSDGDKSLPLLTSASAMPRSVLDWINHRSGHTPAPDAITAAFDWLRHWLLDGVPKQ